MTTENIRCLARIKDSQQLCVPLAGPNKNVHVTYGVEIEGSDTRMDTQTTKNKKGLNLMFEFLLLIGQLLYY